MIGQEVMPQSDISQWPRMNIIENHFKSNFPYFAKVISKRTEEFGSGWCTSFERELEIFFADDIEKLRKAAQGYGLFALDGLRLQKKFDKTLQYIHKHYDDVKNEVYLNRDYMFDLYLPGILLSHYLWPHHYNQKIWFIDNFIPLIQRARSFCDVGVGTGFYSKEILMNVPLIEGHGYDISGFSLEHTKILLERWSIGSRYHCNVQDIIFRPPTRKADCAVNVEVLEHLEDPITFLKALRHMISDGGYAFITAAIDAPNADHIYLYRDLDSIAKHLRAASFNIVAQENFPAFTSPKLNETVPQNGSFIVQAV